MYKILCDQLFVNDTDIPVEEVNAIINNLPLTATQVTSQEIRESLSWFEKNIENKSLLLPWEWSNIFLDVLWLKENDWIQVKVSRKLAAWSLSPRGITIDDTSLDLLKTIRWDVVIWDDVIASWTTVNGLYKRMKSNIDSCEALVLVLRENNNINKKIAVRSWLTVSKVWWWYPKINTLSSLFKSNKRDYLLSYWKSLYWDTFSDDMWNLFFM